MCGQSSAYNTNATLLPTNPLFQGFSSYPNVNKEIILRKLIFQKPRIFGAFSYVKIRILGNARRIIEIQNRFILFGYILEKYYGKIKFRIV